MKKVILASHHNFAAGLRDTLDYICPGVADVVAITAYTSNLPVEEEVEKAIEDFSDAEQILVFTDLLGGSVNQAFVKYLSNQRIKLITGMSLPLVMSTLLTAEDIVTDEEIKHAIESVQGQLIYVNDYMAEQDMDEDDE